MANFKKVLALLLATTSLYSGVVNAAEEGTQKVLVLGANQFEDSRWSRSLSEYGKSWAEHLHESGKDLTMVSLAPDDPVIQYQENLGTHITLNWNNSAQLQDRLISKYPESFDLITTDHCVSDFLYDKTLPSILKTLKPGGQFMFGPLKAHKSMLARPGRPLTRDQIENVKKSGDISFHRTSIGLTDGSRYAYFDMHIEMDPQVVDRYLKIIDIWPGLPGTYWYSEAIEESKEVMKEFVTESFESMTLNNFTAFINEKCDFDVEVQVTNCKRPIIQRVFDNILPPDLPTSCWTNADWIVMTRTN